MNINRFNPLQIFYSPEVVSETTMLEIAKSYSNPILFAIGIGAMSFGSLACFKERIKLGKSLILTGGSCLIMNRLMDHPRDNYSIHAIAIAAFAAICSGAAAQQQSKRKSNEALVASIVVSAGLLSIIVKEACDLRNKAFSFNREFGKELYWIAGKIFILQVLVLSHCALSLYHKKLAYLW